MCGGSCQGGINTVKVFGRVVIGLDSGGAVGLFHDSDFSAQDPLQFLNGGLNVRVDNDLLCRFRFTCLRHTLCQALDLTDGKSLGDYLLGDLALKVSRNSEQAAGVTLGEPAG